MNTLGSNKTASAPSTNIATRRRSNRNITTSDSTEVADHLNRRASTNGPLSLLSLVDTKAIIDKETGILISQGDPNILSKIAKINDRNLEMKKVKGQPIISKIVNKPSVVPLETDFETLCADLTEKFVKRRDFCKKLSVVKLTQSEACLGTSLSVSETLSIVSCET